MCDPIPTPTAAASSIESRRIVAGFERGRE